VFTIDRECVTAPDLQSLFEITKNAKNEWFELGLALGLDDDELTAIENDNPNSLARLRKMLAKYLQKSSEVDWKTVHDALLVPTVDRADVAKKIKEKYLPGTCI